MSVSRLGRGSGENSEEADDGKDEGDDKRLYVLSARLGGIP